MFVGYPRVANGGSKENIVLVSTNVTFLEESYIQDFISHTKVMLKDMSNSIVLQRFLM